MTETVLTVDEVSPTDKDVTLTGDDSNTDVAAEADSNTEAEAEAESNTDVATEGEDPASKEPEEIKIELEGVEMDQEVLDEIVPLFKELGVTNEAANKLAKFYADKQQKDAEAFQSLTSSWLEQAKTDTDIGGDKFEKTVAHAKTFIERAGTPELKKVLDDYGVGNHPEIIRSFAKAGAMMSEDNFHKGDAAKSRPGLLDRLYKD